ncbi:LapA family protein [Rubripirellula amarantea]|nr:LapA family protein [Rubripirellula amarantea]
MTQRERLLSMLVGGLLIAAVVWWGMGKYRSALKLRTNEITRLEQQQTKINEQRKQGELANRQMGEYMVRSLPGNAETARSRYQQWLLSIMEKNELSERSVDPTSSRSMGGLYRQFAFRVQGKARTDNLVDLLYDFYSKDYLHRIRDLSIRPSRTGDYVVEMAIDAIALNAAPADLPEPTEKSWQVDKDLAEYRDSILNRNFFQPPNQAPAYAGSPRVEAVVGRKTTLPLVFKDPEDQNLTYKIISAPEDVVSINDRNGTLEIDNAEKGSFEVLVSVSDDGLPARSTEQKLIVNVVDPPPPPKPEPPKLKFDDAKQTVLTGLVQSGDEWRAWMRVRTRDKTLKLRVGDSFEIGSIKGTVVDLNARFAKIEVDGQQYELRSNGNLFEVTKAKPEPLETPATESESAFEQESDSDASTAIQASPSGNGESPEVTP